MTEATITRTIYSIRWPQTEAMFQEMMKQDMSSMFSETWTKKQDAIHIPYLNLWKSAMQPHAIFDETALQFGYPTNGSSESIVNQLTYLNSQKKGLVVFDEEYEGYSMTAKNINMPIVCISRENYKEYLHLINPERDVFFISQPSAIDGNRWEGFEEFMQTMEEMGVETYVDLTYAGICDHPQIDLTKYTCLGGVFFSLSKLLGVYYHRIGGCFLKKENPLLWPMLWFKNLVSIQYGIYLLNAWRSGCYVENMKHIKNLQKQICSELSVKWGVEVVPSDVPLIATVPYDLEKIPELEGFQRSLKGVVQDKVRICISPYLEKRM